MAPLVIQADKDFPGFFRFAFQQRIILVGVIGFFIVLAGYKVRIGGRVEGVFVFRNGFVQSTRIRKGHVVLAGVGAGHPPHAEHGEDGQREEMLHKWQVRSRCPGLLGTGDRQLLVDVDEVGFEVVGSLERLDGGSVPARDGAQGIPLLHRVGACLGCGFARRLFGYRITGGFGGRRR